LNFSVLDPAVEALVGSSPEVVTAEDPGVAEVDTGVVSPPVVDTTLDVEGGGVPEVDGPRGVVETPVVGSPDVLPALVPVEIEYDVVVVPTVLSQYIAIRGCIPNVLALFGDYNLPFLDGGG